MTDIDLDLRSVLGVAVRLYLVALLALGVYSAAWLYRVWWRAQGGFGLDSVVVSVAWFSVAVLGLLVLVSLSAVWARGRH